MSEIMSVPISDVLGNRDGQILIEESLSKDLPVDGAGASVKEFNRDDAIERALAKPSGRRTVRLGGDVFDPSAVRGSSQMHVPSLTHHFFVLKGKALTFIGSQEMDASKFGRDVSGRFFREWLKKIFPDRRDYERIVSFDDNVTMRDVAELVGICE